MDWFLHDNGLHHERVKLSIKVDFLQFCTEFSKKSTSNRYFIYMHLKGLNMHFKKMVLFITLELTEILGFQAEEIC